MTNFTKKQMQNKFKHNERQFQTYWKTLRRIAKDKHFILFYEVCILWVLGYWCIYGMFYYQNQKRVLWVKSIHDYRFPNFKQTTRWEESTYNLLLGRAQLKHFNMKIPMKVLCEELIPGKSTMGWICGKGNIRKSSKNEIPNSLYHRISLA